MRTKSMLVGLMLLSLASVAEAQKKSHKSSRNRVRCGNGYILPTISVTRSHRRNRKQDPGSPCLLTGQIR